MIPAMNDVNVIYNRADIAISNGLGLVVEDGRALANHTAATSFIHTGRAEPLTKSGSPRLPDGLR